MSVERDPLFNKRLKTRAGVALAASAVLAVAGCDKPAHSNANEACPKFGVYAQNRWAPQGTAERNKPDVLAQKIGGFAGNEVIAVNGWMHTGTAAYPTNTPPWNSDVWFHVANNPEGWVSFAGVRAAPAALDPTGHADGGQPAPTPANCQIKHNS